MKAALGSKLCYCECVGCYRRRSLVHGSVLARCKFVRVSFIQPRAIPSTVQSKARGRERVLIDRPLSITARRCSPIMTIKLQTSNKNNQEHKRSNR
eukprot:scaffold33649_cov191-Skeletonema_dohrnii-CCMP3373.AAC.4